MSNQTDQPRSHLSASRRSDGAARRLYLLVTAFVAGAAVMTIELAGNRILAPWFGNSLYTWTGLIGVILVSISLGYYLGGWLADRRPDYVVLAHLLAVSALLTLLVPILQSLLEDRVGRLGVVSGPVLASLLLFALPGCLLATVSPFAIRLTSLLWDDRNIGISAGSVGMVSTLGSVLGTFGSGFVFIPHLRLRTIFLATGIAVAVLAIVAYGLFGASLRRRRLTTLAWALLLGAAAGALAFTGGSLPESVVFEQTTFYHRIRITEKPTPDGDRLRNLTLDTTSEGSQYVGSRKLPMHYQEFWELARIYCPQLKRAAFLGGGGFAMPEALLDAFPDAHADVVEIDPAVIAAGRKFFRVDEYPRMTPVADDARRFLRLADTRYDFIFADAYNGIRSIPAHLVTREFFELVKSRLDERGVLVMNIISAAEGENSLLFRSVLKTLGAVFPYREAFLVSPGSGKATVQNIFIVAAGHDVSPQSITLTGDYDPQRIDSLFSGYLFPDEYHTAGGVVFTDDCNPVEYLVAQTLRSR
ncbi:MAG: fused MFS/spermidine synthase [Pirellulales bacterium]|nr:fused MFS/spermidine synthase [Pirellulales bacterium]